jgi:hypothetical protein
MSNAPGWIFYHEPPELGHSDTCDGGRVVSVPIADDINPLAIVLVRKQGSLPSGQIDNFSSFCEEYF